MRNTEMLIQDRDLPLAGKVGGSPEGGWQEEKPVPRHLT
jgi:hypothetical protein